MGTNPQFRTDSNTFNEEILNRKILCISSTIEIHKEILTQNGFIKSFYHYL